ARAVAEGRLGRFDAVDPTDGGRTSRYSLSTEWQRGGPSTLTKVTAYGIGYDLSLFSNFTFFLHDPLRGDQIEQVDHRLIAGLEAVHRRVARWRGRPAQNTVGVHLRSDDISALALYHTQARVRFDTRIDDTALVTSGGVYAQNEVAWTPWLRTT